MQRWTKTNFTEKMKQKQVKKSKIMKVDRQKLVLIVGKFQRSEHMF